MKLTRLRLSNFQSFGPVPTTIDLAEMCFLLGPNGSGKTAVLQALARLFGFDPALRRVRRTDFHIKVGELDNSEIGESVMWIEAQFDFPELKDSGAKDAAIPVYFAHMQLEAGGDVPRMRIRLTAKMDEDGEIEETMTYVLQVDDNDEPVKVALMPKHDRNAIKVHYLPARRDPTEHISYAANSLLGRALRAADWQAEREKISDLTTDLSKALAGNEAVASIGDQLSEQWAALHKGIYYERPRVSFVDNELDNILRHLTVKFTTGPGEDIVDFSRLSDGQQSLLYISLVLSVQSIGRQVLAQNLKAFDVDKLRPAVFTMVAIEEPENSLSPHYLGRVVKALTTFSGHYDAQAIVATHAPTLLKRVAPEDIRYLRLSESRETLVTSIVMPATTHEAYKFVREAVQAFPELYFSRLVILGEGDSEGIVLPRLLQARGISEDDVSVSVAPLGGRHVNHFWRLLHGLGIPHATLLDLDLGRYEGGWGRVKYVLHQLRYFSATSDASIDKKLVSLPKWNGDEFLLESERGKNLIEFLESADVFFSSPLDLDFAMLRQFPNAYGVSEGGLDDPDDKTIAAVLGKSHGNFSQYSKHDQQYFDVYHKHFKFGSKPVTHIAAMATLDDATLNKDMPRSIDRLLEVVRAKLADLPE